LVWMPETERVNRVIVKNARGHAFYEYGEPMLREPDEVWAAPLESLTAAQQDAFENIQGDGMLAGWPEVGSRMMTRVMTGQDLRDGWVIVQDGVYRYGVGAVWRDSGQIGAVRIPRNRGPMGRLAL